MFMAPWRGYTPVLVLLPGCLSSGTLACVVASLERVVASDELPWGLDLQGRPAPCARGRLHPGFLRQGQVASDCEPGNHL